MANTKYTYVYGRYDTSIPNNNLPQEKSYIICEDPYDFWEYLRDLLDRCPDEYGRPLDFEPGDDDFEHTKSVPADFAGMDFWILDADGERTGEVYRVLSVEPTDEDLVG